MRVALMVTCINDALFPGTGRAVVTLLRRLGVEVDFPEAQTCCGQPMVNTGYLDEAVPPLRSFVKAFDGYDAIVTPSGSCAGSARHQHGIVAQRSGDPALVAAVERTAPRTHELSEFLVDVLGVTDVGAYFPHRVTYHPTCHSLRMLGVGDRPLRLLHEVRGLDLVELPGAEECCGFGGTFAVKNADTSVAMVSDKVRHVRETGAEVVVAGDNSCLMNIGGALTRQRAGVRVMHLAEVLAATEHPRRDS
jgi:L-lactate dehydrogenase complex protein LldE